MQEQCEAATQTPVKTYSSWIRRQVALMQDPDEYAFDTQAELSNFEKSDSSCLLPFNDCPYFRSRINDCTGDRYHWRFFRIHAD